MSALSSAFALHALQPRGAYCAHLYACRKKLSPPAYLPIEGGAAHSLVEEMAKRSDCGVGHLQSQNSTMLKTTGQIIKPKTALPNLAGEPSKASRSRPVSSHSRSTLLRRE